MSTPTATGPRYGWIMVMLVLAAATIATAYVATARQQEEWPPQVVIGQDPVPGTDDTRCHLAMRLDDGTWHTWTGQVGGKICRWELHDGIPWLGDGSGLPAALEGAWITS